MSRGSDEQMSGVEMLTMESMELCLPTSTALVVVKGGFGVEGIEPADFGPDAIARMQMADLNMLNN